MTAGAPAAAPAHRARPRRPAWAGPLATAAAGAGAAAYLVLTHEPAGGGAFVPCPLHATTGLFCPGCGITRATRELLRGDPLAALARNPFTPVILGLVAWAWLAWAAPAVRPGLRVPPPGDVLRPSWAMALASALVVFGIARNLPLPILHPLRP